jgi:hypothetical protein
MTTLSRQLPADGLLPTGSGRQLVADNLFALPGS